MRTGNSLHSRALPGALYGKDSYMANTVQKTFREKKRRPANSQKCRQTPGNTGYRRCQPDVAPCQLWEFGIRPQTGYRWNTKPYSSRTKLLEQPDQAFMRAEGLRCWWGGHWDIRFALIYCKLKNLLFPWSSSHIQGGQTHIIPPWLLGKVLRIKTRRHAVEGSENRAAVATAPPNLQDLSRYGSVLK